MVVNDRDRPDPVIQRIQKRPLMNDSLLDILGGCLINCGHWNLLILTLNFDPQTNNLEVILTAQGSLLKSLYN